jgi:NAD(P)-dependent dehydrogenase (short-subunit alcohol dehydrogenase family)
LETIVITGANRGLGLAFTQHYLERGDTVFATARQPETAEDLNALHAQYPKQLFLLALDIRHDDSIAEFAKQVAQHTQAIDLLINNAGVNGLPNTRGLLTVTRQALNEMMDNNAVSPVIVTQALLGLLKNSLRPRVVMISSQMGSLDYVKSGMNYGYTMSKAAMNMASRVLSAELSAQGVISITTHPGWVRTDMGGSSGELSPQESASSLMRVFDGLTSADSGKFYRWNGTTHNW